jgi:hypothetical protein
VDWAKRRQWARGFWARRLRPRRLLGKRACAFSTRETQTIAADKTMHRSPSVRRSSLRRCTLREARTDKELARSKSKANDMVAGGPLPPTSRPRAQLAPTEYKGANEWSWLENHPQWKMPLGQQVAPGYLQAIATVSRQTSSNPAAQRTAFKKAKRYPRIQRQHRRSPLGLVRRLKPSGGAKVTAGSSREWLG